MYYENDREKYITRVLYMSRANQYWDQKLER